MSGDGAVSQHFEGSALEVSLTYDVCGKLTAGDSAAINVGVMCVAPVHIQHQVSINSGAPHTEAF